jgi:hypothetical protein
MRRRAIGLGLLAFGAVLLGAALAVRLFLDPTMVRLPLDQTGSTTVADENGSYFDQETLEQRQGYVEANVVVQGDPGSDEATDDVAVWVSGTTITNEDHKVVTPPTEMVVCLDRHSAESVACDSAAINKEPADIQGLTVTFPLGTEPRDYEVWNSNIGASATAKYVGEEQLDGVTVYRFEQSIPEQVIDHKEVPSSFAGGSEAGNVTADVVFTNDRTFFVEPTSGMIVKATESPDIVLRGPDGATGVTILSADLAPEDAAVAAKVADAADTRDQITLVRSTLPLVLVVLGVVLVAVGLFLRLGTGRRSPGRHEVPAQPEPATVSQAS